MVLENNNNKVIAFRIPNEITNYDVDSDQDFDQDFYLDNGDKNYISLDFIFQKLHLNEEQMYILTSNLKKLLKQFEDEIEADEKEFQAKEREHKAKMAHYRAKAKQLLYNKEQLDNGVAIEDLEGIAYFDGDFGSFGLYL